MDDTQSFSSFQHFNEDVTDNVNIFNCEFCDQTFNQQFDLQNHIFYNHEQELQNLKNSLNNDYPPPEEEVNFSSSNPQENGLANNDGLSSIIRSSFELSSQDFDSYDSHAGIIEENSENNVVEKASSILTGKNDIEYSNSQKKSGGEEANMTKTSSGNSDFFGNLIDNTVTHQNYGGAEPSNDDDEDVADDEMDDDDSEFDDEYLGDDDDDKSSKSLKNRPIQSLQTAMNEVQDKFSEPESSPENIPETENNFEEVNDEPETATKKQKLTSADSNSVPTYCNFKKDFFGEGNVYSIEIKDCEKEGEDENQTICEELSFQDLRFKKQMEVGNICSVVEMILQKFLGDDLSFYNVSGHEYGISNERNEKIQVEISQKKHVPDDLVTKLVEFADFVLPEYLVEKFSSVKVIKRTIAKVCSKHSMKKRGGSTSGNYQHQYYQPPAKRKRKNSSDHKNKNSVKPSSSELILPNQQQHYYPHQYYPQMYPPPGFHSNNPNAAHSNSPQSHHHPQMYHHAGFQSGAPPPNNPHFNPYYHNQYPNASPYMNMYPPSHYPQMYHPVPGFHSGAPPQTPFPPAYGNNPVNTAHHIGNQLDKSIPAREIELKMHKILKFTKKEKAKSIAKRMKIGVNIPGLKQPINLDDSGLPKNWKR